MTVPREFDSLGVIFERLDSFLADSRVDDRSRFVLRLALEELFTNLVKYNPEGEATIGISLTLGEREVAVTIIDRGVRPFDVTIGDARGLDLPLEERRVGGLGLHLVRTLVDRLEYTHNDNQSTITLTKTLER
jgi:anti-sigma regulatory factor (Ser/Thr protein kinase)